MGHLVGAKGQIVIEKDIREKLGIQPGWQALQVIVDNHIEVYFVPPPHRRSLAGALAHYLERPAREEDEDDWDKAVALSRAEDYLKKDMLE